MWLIMIASTCCGNISYIPLSFMAFSIFSCFSLPRLFQVSFGSVFSFIFIRPIFSASFSRWSSIVCFVNLLSSIPFIVMYRVAFLLPWVMIAFASRLFRFLYSSYWFGFSLLFIWLCISVILSVSWSMIRIMFS